MLTYQRTEGRDPRTVAAGGSQAAEGRSPSGSSLNCQWSLHAAAARPLSAHPTKETQTDHSAAAFSHFRSVPKPAPSPACGRSSAPTPSAPWRPHFARLRVGAGPASPRKRRFPARGARQLRPALPRRENHISHNPMGCPLRLRGPACAATRPGRGGSAQAGGSGASGLRKGCSPGDGNGVCGATEAVSTARARWGWRWRTRSS